MSKALKVLEKLKKEPIYIEEYMDTFYKEDFMAEKLDVIEKELKALEIIKDFVWIKRGEICLGVRGDIETILMEGDFESKDEYDLLKEVLLCRD